MAVAPTDRCSVKMSDGSLCGRVLHTLHTAQGHDEQPLCIMHSRDPHKSDAAFQREFDSILKATEQDGAANFSRFVFRGAHYGNTRATMKIAEFASKCPLIAVSRRNHRGPSTRSNAAKGGPHWTSLRMTAAETCLVKAHARRPRHIATPWRRRRREWWNWPSFRRAAGCGGDSVPRRRGA